LKGYNMGVAIRNVSQTEHVENISIPTKPDGSYYRFELIANGGWSRYYDDTTEGLMNFLIPNYENFPPGQKLAARIKHAVDLQVRLQARLNMFFASEPRTEEEQKILIGPRNEQPSIEYWETACPLVLVDAFYTPYTDNKQPISAHYDVNLPENLWWLRPAESEVEYLRSLHETSLIDLHTISDEVV
jgi:hypothetical protein